jgi:hypothetical protein
MSDTEKHDDSADKASDTKDEAQAAPIQSETKESEVPDDLADEDYEDSLVAEFLLFLKEEKKWWLAPMVIVLLAIAGLFIFVEGSAVAPFIYTLF